MAPRVEKTEVFRKGWNFANRTYFANYIMRKHYFLCMDERNSVFSLFLPRNCFLQRWAICLHSQLKVAATDMRYLARSKLSRCLVHKKNFSLMWQVVFKLGYLFVKRCRIPFLSLNELGEKSQATIILGEFVNNP